MKFDASQSFRQDGFSANQNYNQQPIGKVPNPIEDKFGPQVIYKFHNYPENELPNTDKFKGLGNLEYIITLDGGDLARDIIISISTTPEDRAFQFMKSLMGFFFREANDTKRTSIQIFLKHTMKSCLGTHCIFGVEYKGFEVEEHSFIVHLDKNNRVVMICCTYLPTLSEMLKGEFDKNLEGALDKKISDEMGEMKIERAEAEKLWLAIWDNEKGEYIIAPGKQVKLNLPIPKKRDIFKKQPNVLGISTDGEKRYNNSPGLFENTGLGNIIRQFLETTGSFTLDVLGDATLKKNSIETNIEHDNVMDDPNSTMKLPEIKFEQAVLRSLESDSELIGKYAAIRDGIDLFAENKKGIFTNESFSSFDRVTAYYHLDYIQRYFRENLGFQILDNYPHLNPVQINLSINVNTAIAEYDVIKEKIIFYQLKNDIGFTAVRDPRFIYHEYLHVVTDAIARLHRSGTSITPRSKENLQAQAMDEGLADYFACSLANQQGAKKALFYFVKRKRWKINRDLDPEKETKKFSIINFKGAVETEWRTLKYRLGEQWGRCLWNLRKQVGTEVADMLIAYSIFFLTRWATFRQGIQAIRLADWLLFSGTHKEAIENIENQMNLTFNDEEMANLFPTVEIDNPFIPKTKAKT